MTNHIPHILKTASITLFPPGAPPITVNSDHMNFVAVGDAIRAGDYAEALVLASVKTFITRASAGAVIVNEDGVTFNGVPINNYLTGKMMQFFAEGAPIEHYCRFLHNLMANPSMTSREELYLFLEAANLPITEDGCFLAYKAVTSDFLDKHSRKFNNSPGSVLEMPRREVDDNRERTCSYGFHAAAYEYAKGFMSYGDKLVSVKINPADVVSVPSDYNNQKLRTAKYVVVEEIVGAGDTLTGRAFVNTAPDVDDDEEEGWPDANDYCNDCDCDEDFLTDYKRGYNAGFGGYFPTPVDSTDYYAGYLEGLADRSGD